MQPCREVREHFLDRREVAAATQHVPADDFRPGDKFVGSCSRFRLHLTPSHGAASNIQRAAVHNGPFKCIV
jgi:hypothetical protein